MKFYDSDDSDMVESLDTFMRAKAIENWGFIRGADEITLPGNAFTVWTKPVYDAPTIYVRQFTYGVFSAEWIDYPRSAFRKS